MVFLKGRTWRLLSLIIVYQVEKGMAVSNKSLHLHFGCIIQPTVRVFSVMDVLEGGHGTSPSRMVPVKTFQFCLMPLQIFLSIHCLMLNALKFSGRAVKIFKLTVVLQ